VIDGKPLQLTASPGARAKPRDSIRVASGAAAHWVEGLGRALPSTSSGGEIRLVGSGGGWVGGVALLMEGAGVGAGEKVTMERANSGSGEPTSASQPRQRKTPKVCLPPWPILDQQGCAAGCGGTDLPCGTVHCPLTDMWAWVRRCALPQSTSPASGSKPILQRLEGSKPAHLDMGHVSPMGPRCVPKRSCADIPLSL